MKTLISIASILFFTSTISIAGEVTITNVDAKQQNNGQYTFDVTLEHADEGWDHYANSWKIFTPEGNLLGERILAHPHVNEQPFTRSLNGVKIPTDVDSVYINAYDSVHGESSTPYNVELEK